MGNITRDAESFPEKVAAEGGERKVLAGEAGPEDAAVADGGSVDLLNGTEVEMLAA